MEHAGGGLESAAAEDTELAQGLWYWAQDSGAAEASQQAIQATLRRMGRLHPLLFQRHGGVGGTPPLEARTLFLQELAVVDPAAAAAARAAESGYGSDSEAMDMAAGSSAGPPEAQWHDVVDKRAARYNAAKARKAAAKASTAAKAPAVRKVATAKKASGHHGGRRVSFAGGIGAAAAVPTPPPAASAARFPRAAQQGGKAPYWSSVVAASPLPSDAPTGSAGTGAGRHGRR